MASAYSRAPVAAGPEPLPAAQAGPDGVCVTLRSMFCVPNGRSTQIAWRFVGDGRGSYDVAEYSYVGDELGHSRPPGARATSWAQPCTCTLGCVANYVLVLLGMLLVVGITFLVASFVSGRLLRH
mmetsp:Transcript_39122/g.110563  ORF Transcript_39122/g.110563 Transcript_39122/m.110563 type:complete len:125 (-) Transcript_39122:166-540(-)